MFILHFLYSYELTTIYWFIFVKKKPLSIDYSILCKWLFTDILLETSPDEVQEVGVTRLDGLLKVLRPDPPLLAFAVRDTPGVTFRIC